MSKPLRYQGTRKAKNPPFVQLHWVRRATGKTLKEVAESVAEHTGRPCGPGTISAIEGGTRGCSQQMLNALAHAYGIPEGTVLVDYEPTTPRGLVGSS